MGRLLGLPVSDQAAGSKVGRRKLARVGSSPRKGVAVTRGPKWKSLGGWGPC